MDRSFGWDLPPGVRLSDPGGPEDPARLEAEAVSEQLGEALYRATRAGFTVEDINREWAMAAEDAFDDEESDAAAETQMEKQLEEDLESHGD